jgi:hypothetical protein
MIPRTPDRYGSRKDELDTRTAQTKREWTPEVTRPYDSPPDHARPVSAARRYFRRGRHRARRRPTARALQISAALAVIGVLSVLVGNIQSTFRLKNVDAAVRAEPAPPPPTPMTPADPASTSAPASSSAESAQPSTTSSVPTSTQPSSTPSSEKPTTPPTWLPVTQAAAQPTDQIGTWLNKALGILKANGYSESQMNANGIRTMIQNESGGNPSAINLWDSNAAAGTPSKGLMQTIDSTFKNWSLPGHRDIWNPVDNIIAAVRYAIATYGSISKVPGVAGVSSGGGYQGY